MTASASVRTDATLSRRLRLETHDLHMIAERSGIMRPLLRGVIDLRSYAVLLRNLHAIYSVLETRMVAHAADRLIAPFVHPALQRTERLARDLEAIEGAGWASTLYLAPAAGRYLERLTTINAAGLLAHAYVRYFGDVSGGQHIARIVGRSLGPAISLEFYDFAELGGLDGFKDRVRAQMDDLQLAEPAVADVIGEARWAFHAHAALFNELEALRVLTLGMPIDSTKSP